MQASTTLCLLFATFALTIPWPLLGPFELFAPSIRYLLLASITAAVALAEGASGPVPLILALFAANTLLYLLCNAVLAWGFTKWLANSSRATRGRIVIAICSTLLILSISLHLYRTPFGSLPRSNLLGLLS